MTDVKILTADTFDAFIQASFAVVDFWAPWCGPCRGLLPILDKIAQEHNINIGKISIEDESAQNLIQQYQVRSIPTLLFFSKGQLVATQVGAPQEKDLLAIIAKHRG